MIAAVSHWWIAALWAVFLFYWAIAALFVKKGADRVPFRRGVALRLVLFLAILVTVLIARRSANLDARQWAELQSVPMALAGAVLASCGAAIAFSARAVIGRNWGSPGMRKTDTQLVTRGPYRLVRHPIYLGILLMMIGTAIGLIPAWWLVAGAAAVYFIISARAEEKYMAERFPETYPAYRARTWMLVPYLF